MPKGKYAGVWMGKVAVRASGGFDLKDASGNRICQGINYRYCRLIQRTDGWQYEKYLRKEGNEADRIPPTTKVVGFLRCVP